MKLIDLHYKWLEAGDMDKFGLCNSIPKKYEKQFELLRPTIDDKNKLDKSDKPVVYWGSESYNGVYEIKYTPRRQTIVLFICAMKGEI